MLCEMRSGNCSISIGAGALGNAEYSFIANAPRSTLARSGRALSGAINGLNRTKLNCLN